MKEILNAEQLDLLLHIPKANYFGATCVMRMLIIVTLLFSLLPAQAEAEKIKRQKFPKGSPEAVVEALMYYDYTNKLRGEDSLKNPYLTFAPELVGQSDPLAVCGYVMAFVDSYRIVGSKPGGVQVGKDSPTEYYVTVEAVVRGVDVHSSLLAVREEGDRTMARLRGAEGHNSLPSTKNIKCGWLDLRVLNRRTGIVDETFRGNIDNPTELLNVLDRVGYPVEADIGDKRYLVDPERRLWSFEVSLVRDVAGKRWILKMPFTPYHIALPARKVVWQKIVRMTNDAVEHCAGRQPRPKWWTWQECDQKELERSLKSGQLGMDFIYHMERD